MANAKLNDPIGTGIAVREVFSALRKQGAGKIIALMDMNRSITVIVHVEAGEPTLYLANEMVGIATVLFCKLEELSYGTYTTFVLDSSQ